MTKDKAPEIFRERFCLRLGDEFDRCGKTQTELARVVGYNGASLNRLLTGRSLPSLWVFVKLCRAMGASADLLLGLKTIKEVREDGNKENGSAETRV